MQLIIYKFYCRLSCAGTHRPQCIDKSDCDANTPNISECITLRDPVFHQNVDGEDIVDDSLMNIAKYYMKALENYGEANRYMNRAKNNSASIVWPPIAEFANLDRQLGAWQETLPKPFQFNQKNLDHHRKHATSNYLNIWLSGQAIWCSSMMILHRASLAFSDITPTDTSVPEGLYRRIQQSINTCRMCVDSAMGIFGAIKDLCGCNTLPYMGYSAYVFATVLMTSTFSSTPELCEKSGRGLKILYELIDVSQTVDVNMCLTLNSLQNIGTGTVLANVRKACKCDSGIISCPSKNLQGASRTKEWSSISCQ